MYRESAASHGSRSPHLLRRGVVQEVEHRLQVEADEPEDEEQHYDRVERSREADCRGPRLCEETDGHLEAGRCNAGHDREENDVAQILQRPVPGTRLATLYCGVENFPIFPADTCRVASMRRRSTTPLIPTIPCDVFLHISLHIRQRKRPRITARPFKTWRPKLDSNQRPPD